MTLNASPFIRQASGSQQRLVADQGNADHVATPMTGAIAAVTVDLLIVLR